MAVIPQRPEMSVHLPRERQSEVLEIPVIVRRDDGRASRFNEVVKRLCIVFRGVNMLDYLKAQVDRKTAILRCKIP